MRKLIIILVLALILLTGCDQSSSIGIIGGSDGPTSIIVTK